MQFIASLFVAVSIGSIILDNFVPQRKPGQKWGAINWVWTALSVFLFMGLWWFLRVFLNYLEMHSIVLTDHSIITNLRLIAALIAVPVAVVSIVKMNRKVLDGNPDANKGLITGMSAFYGVGTLIGYYELVCILLTYFLSNNAV